MVESGSETRSGIGVRLRAGREKMGLTLLQVAEKLHVDAKVVESLESERFDALGAPVFVRGHLRHYAELIGEQPGELLGLYVDATKPAMPDLTRLPKAAPAGRPSRLAVPALMVLIGFVLLGVVWWLVQSLGNPGDAKPRAAAQPMTIEPAGEQDSISQEALGDATGGNPNAAGVNLNAAGAELNGTASGANGRSTSARNGPNNAAPPASNASPRASGPPAARAASGATGTQAAALAPGSPTAAAVTGATTPAPVRGKPVEVTLKFAADSWVEIYDANGEKLFYDIGAADSSHTVSGTPPLRVTFGNAPGVALDVNGKPATVPANAVNGDAAQFTINRSGLIVRARQTDGG